ncbi:MAG: tetratricopeptide repeat protein [Paludibacteraceae bacterium]|nr:tetratricopeptide repeat protein [Paludibacteraceae bacterium]
MNVRKLILAILLCTSVLAGAQSTKESYNIRRAMEAAQSQDWETSLNFLGQELQVNPTNGYAYAFAAIICDIMDYKHVILPFSKRALELLPKKDWQMNAEMRHRQARIYFEAEDSTKAEKLWKDALYWHRDVDYYNNIADLMEKQDRFDELETLAKQCMKAFPKDPVSFNILASVQYDMKQYEEAVATVDKGLKTCKEMKKWQEGMLRSTKTDALRKLHRYDEALPECMKTARLLPPRGCPKLVTLADSMDMQIVLDSVEAAFQQKPTEVNWLLIESDIYEHHNNYVQAAYQSLRAAKVEEQAGLYTGAGEMILTHIGDAELSEQYYLKALEVDSLRARSWMGLARLYHDLGRYDESLKAIQRCIDLDPEHKNSGSICYLRGRIYHSMHNYEQALDDYTRELVRNPREKHFWTYLVTLYKAVGDTAAAKKAIEQGCREMGDNISAEMYIVMGDSAAAYEKTKQMVKNDNRWAEHYNAACAYARILHTDEALAELERAFEQGCRSFYHIAWDDDLDSIRELPEFKELVAKYKAVSLEETAELKRLISTL